MSKLTFASELAALGRPLLWRRMTSSYSAIPQAMLPFLHSAGETVNLRVIEGPLGVLVIADPEGKRKLARRHVSWSRKMAARFVAEPDGLIFIAFEGGILVAWANKVEHLFNLEDVAEVPAWSADSAYQETRLSHRFPLSPTGVRFSSKVAEGLELTPGAQLYLHRFSMWGGYSYLLSTLSSTGGHPVRAWKEGRLHLDIEWLKPLTAHQSAIHAIGITGVGLLVLPSRAATVDPVMTPVLPDLSRFNIIGRREQKVVPFRKGLHCVDIPGAVLHTAGFKVGDVLAIERPEGTHCLVIRKDPAGRQKVRYVGNSAAFRLGSTALNWCGARESVQSIACDGAVVVVDGSLGRDIPELPRVEGSTTIPSRLYPRPEGRLQLGGSWLREMGFEPGMNYRIEFHKRGLVLAVHENGPFQVTAQNPGSAVPKVYVPGEFMETLKAGATQVGVILKRHGQVLVVPRNIVCQTGARPLGHLLAARSG